MKSRLFLFMATLFVMQNVCGEDKFGQQKERWLQIAQENMPTLQKRVVEPLRVVEAVKDEKVFQGWTYKTSSFRLEDFYKTNFSSLRSITLDFGEHLTGYCTIRLKTTDRTWDAPTRLKMTFGEVPAEMNTPFDPFPGGLSRGWMQDETVEFMEVDMDREITLPRRLSMRYLKIELLGTSSGYNFAIDKLYFTAQSSAGEVQTSLLPTCPKMFRD
ncbi:MAG: glycoside hydrolase, partial [Bacteroidaceae bacterium]|nr:glycoside hydrolase [Bacteroidaceae bacterium]